MTSTPAPDPAATEPAAATPAELLAVYDERLRTDAEVHDALDVVRQGPLLWARFDRGGFVTYRDLGGAQGEGLDALIAATVAHFRDDTDVPEVEWKTRGHDRPADLPQRLVAHGFVAEDVESVLIGEAALLAQDLPLPDGVTLRRAGDGGDLLDDVRRAGAMQEAVFGGPGGPAPDRLAESLRAEPDRLELWLAEADGEVVCAGRLTGVPGTDVAGIWGGATLPQWRRRGIYRALTAARARSALRMGARYVHSDSTEFSRPVLERSGLVKVTTTTPYVWRREP